MKTKLNWWQTILSCLGFLAIFLIVAVLTDSVTKWIDNRSIRFIIREIVLRLPITLYVMKLFAVKILKADLSNYNIKNGAPRIFEWILVGLIISVGFLIITLLINDVNYMNKSESYSNKWIVYFIVSTIAMAINGGIIEETLFRGYIMGLIKDKWGVKIAVIIPSMLFGLMHLTMIENFKIIDVLLLFIGGSMVGIMYSLIVIQTKNIYYASAVHLIWNLFFAGRVLKISSLPFDDLDAIFCFHINNSNTLLNGATFGVEVSVVAVIIYLTTSILLLKRKF